MVNNHYRWDFIGLSTDDKPTSETSEKVVNGSTYYCSDTSKLYVYCNGTWYERKPLGGGGGGGGTSDFDELDNRPKYNGSLMTGDTNIPLVPTVNNATLTVIQNGTSAGTFTANSSTDTTIALTDTTYSNFTGTDGTAAGVAGLVPAPATTDAGKFLKADGTWDTAGGGSVTPVQTTGTSQTDVMSQNATTSMVYADPSTKITVKIGDNASTSTWGSAVAVGRDARVTHHQTVAIGYGATALGRGAIALGAGASAEAGTMNIGASNTTYGYNSSNYRLLTGLYAPQSAHDAATKGYVDPTTDSSAPTTATVGRLGQIQIDTTNNDAYMCVAVDDITPAYTWKKITV